MKELNLILKKIWFETTLKRYEYREIKPYYQKKFCKNYGSFMFCKRSLCSFCPYFKSKKFDVVILRNGYTNKIRSFNRSNKFYAEIKPIDPIDWDRYQENFIKDGYKLENYYFCIDLTI